MFNRKLSKCQDNDVESIIYSPYVPCDLWGWIMWASVKIQMLWSIGKSFVFLFLKSDIWRVPDSRSVPPFSLLLQDSGNRYTINTIYKDESQCPVVQYKCKRPNRGRQLVWQRQQSDNFKGRDVNPWWLCHPAVMTKPRILWTIWWIVSGCPVHRQSCNTTSSNVLINNVLSKEAAYTFSMCSGMV